MTKTPVYFMPGLAASSKIFEYIQLNENKFDCFYLEWLEPLNTREPLHDYIKRLAKDIKHPKAVLIGVSFGGIIVQELGRIVNAKQVIIVSSIQKPEELPIRLQLVKNTKAYRATPIKLLSNFDLLEKIVFGSWAKKRFELYKKYLSMNSTNYLKWAFYNVLHWQKSENLAKPIHIHGDQDEIFPINRLKPDYIIPEGTHIMIVNRAKWFNKYLEAIILGI